LLGDVRQVVCSTEDYLPYLTQEVEMDSVPEARKILESAHDQGLVSGRSPLGFAGAALYVVNEKDLTQREIADAAGVTGETIRVRVKELREVESGVIQEYA
jgi:transcription initiation factor TFIIB